MATAPMPQNPLPFMHPDDMPKLYALTGVGRCMDPVVADGALLTFDKEEPPRVGDVVGIVFTADYATRYGAPGCVKRLKLALPPRGFTCATGLVVVEQLNPPRIYAFDDRDVLAVHKCVGFAQPDGDGRARFQIRQEAPRC